MSSARKLDALLRNYEHTHVIDELRSWLDENNAERTRLINDENNRLFKFTMTQTVRSPPLPPRLEFDKLDLTRTVEVNCIVVHQSALKHKYLPNALQAAFDNGLGPKVDRLYSFLDKKTGKVVTRQELHKCDKITTRISKLPDTLFISVNRMGKVDTTGMVDSSGLQCPKVIDFRWDGYKALLSPEAKQRRYVLVGAIVGESDSQRTNLDEVASGSRGPLRMFSAFEFSAFALVRCGHGVWYRVDNADGLHAPGVHGKLVDQAEVGKLLHPDGCVGSEKHEKHEQCSTFVMRLYYRVLEEVLPAPPFKKEQDMAHYPNSFIGLFDGGPLERKIAMEGVVERATQDVADNNPIGMIEFMQRMPPLDEEGADSLERYLTIGVGPANATPEALLMLFDLRPDVLIGRTVFEVFRVRSLLAVLGKYFAHAGMIGHDEATSKAILTWAVREWTTLSDKAKRGWILVADYFNTMFADRLALEVEADRQRVQRISAFNLFVEQWPVLVGKKLAYEKTEEEIDAQSTGWSMEGAGRPNDVLQKDDRTTIDNMVANHATMNDIWNDMHASAKATFAELARWRNNLDIGFDQGTYEVWERIPWLGLVRTKQVDDDAVAASVVRMDLVRQEMVDKDPRAIRIKEIRNTPTPKPKTLANAHVQLAMMEEASNPYVHYSTDNFALTAETRTARVPKDDPNTADRLVRETISATSVDVDPFVDVDLEGKCARSTSLCKLLDVQASHINYGVDNEHAFLTSHCIVNTPDTIAVRVTPWTQKLVRQKGIGPSACGVNYEVAPGGGLVDVSCPLYIDRRTFAGYREDGTKYPHQGVPVPDRYDLVGILAIQRPKPPATPLTDSLPTRNKMSRDDWNALGNGKDQTDSLVTDSQREQIYKLVATWGREDAAGNPPPAHQRLHIYNTQLDAMLRAATGVLRLSLGRVQPEPGETKEQAVQECVERTMINLFALREHYISQELWKQLFDIVNGEAPCPPDAINKQLCAVMKQLKDPTDHEWRVAKELRQAPVSKSVCVYLIAKYLGQGTAFLGSSAAVDILPVDAVCTTESEDVTPVACMIPPPKRERFWQRGMHPDQEGVPCRWTHFEAGGSGRTRCTELPETFTVGVDADTDDEHSAIFYFRRAENWKRETDFVQQLIAYDRGYGHDERFPDPLPERSLRLMAQSPFLRRELYNVAVESIRSGEAKRNLLQFMGWLTYPFGKEQETAIRMISDPNVRQETLDSFLRSKAFSKKGIEGFYVKANKSKKVASTVGGGLNGKDGDAPELTEEEREQLAIEHAKELKRKWTAEAEARARKAALEAEQRERERVAAEEAAAREAAIRERLAADAAERVARAAEEAEAAREARLARQARDSAQQEARDAARRTKESDEQARKKALAKQKSEERKAAKAANKDRKKGPSAIKLEDERKKKHSEEVARQEAEAKAAAKAAEAKEAAKRAAAAAAAAPAQAEAEARTAAAEARAAARAAERAAERSAILEASELADQREFELAEEWASEQATEVPPSSPMSTSTAASTAPSSAWTHGASDIDAQCVICFEGVRDHLCLPCKHLCVCARCVAGTSLATCPMCRQPVEEILNVFW